MSETLKVLYSHVNLLLAFNKSLKMSVAVLPAYMACMAVLPTSASINAHISSILGSASLSLDLRLLDCSATSAL